jgi:hypothetical protein
MEARKQAILSNNVTTMRPSAPLAQVDELRAAEVMSHGFGNAELAQASRRARRRAAAECFRADLVCRVRAEIARGTYPDGEQLSIAVERLCLALVHNVEYTLERKAAG